MIYTGQLAIYVKKSFGEKVIQVHLDKIINHLNLDPEVSQMDVVVLGSRDLSVAPHREKFKAAMEYKHPKVGVLYLYNKDKEKSLVDGIPGIKAVKLNRSMDAQGVKEAVEEVLKDIEISQKNRTFVSKDQIAVNSVQPKVEPEEVIEDTVVREDEQAILISEDTKEEIPMPEQVEPINAVKVVSIEDRVRELSGFADWDLFKQLLKKDVVIRDLMQESNQFAGTVNMLVLLDKKITNIFRDEALTADQRFEKITEIGLERSAYKATMNNIITEKVIAVVNTITASAQETVDRRIKAITKALDKFATESTVYYKKDKEVLRALIDERIEIQMELLALVKELITLYQQMDKTVGELINGFDSDLPSENQYINEVYAVSKALFTPQNVSELVNKLTSDLQGNRITFSLLEKSIHAVIAKVFQLCEIDGSIIQQQDRLIKLLEANQVEDVIIVDTLLKNTLRLYVGPSDVGTRATAITWSGILARRNNTLLVDLSGASKFREYGIEPHSVEDFLASRDQEQLMCVEGNIGSDLEYLEEIVAEIKTRLDYYKYVNIILDSSQLSVLNALAEHALSVTFITDCTNRANNSIRNSSQEFMHANVAKKIVLIDPPEDTLSIVNDLTLDPLTVKVVRIPHLTEMKSYSYRAMQPYKNMDIVRIFEEAFR